MSQPAARILAALLVVVVAIPAISFGAPALALDPLSVVATLSTVGDLTTVDIAITSNLADGITELEIIGSPPDGTTVVSNTPAAEMRGSEVVWYDLNGLAAGASVAGFQFVYRGAGEPVVSANYIGATRGSAGADVVAGATASGLVAGGRPDRGGGGGGDGGGGGSGGTPACSAATGIATGGGGWATSGASIVAPATATAPAQPFVIAGINWYGFETTGFVAHGLYAKDYTFIIDQIKQLGFNTIRIPFSNEMWETNPAPAPNTISACPTCKGKRSRDILAQIVNYAGSRGLHVILDNHRSDAGNGPAENGLWYITSRGQNFPESSWINDWCSIQHWLHGQPQSLGAQDTVTVNYLASDGLPVLLGLDLRNEPHTPSRTPYLNGATWGTGDGIDPNVNPVPNPFSPACVATGSCHDWRLAAERAADLLFGDAAANGWDYPLMIVEGIGQYPVPGGTAAGGPYDFYWWGGQLQGVNGNAAGGVINPGAPIVFNAGGNASSLGPPVNNKLVYSAHDFGPTTFNQGWFNGTTCYAIDCSGTSLAGIWRDHWAYIDLAIAPVAPSSSPDAYPWPDGQQYTQAPVFVGEFGTGNSADDLISTGPGSQGQWFTDMVNFIQSSYAVTDSNNPGIPLQSLHWTYWAVNGEDRLGLLDKSYSGLANPTKLSEFLCTVQQTDAACVGTNPPPAS